MSEPGYIELQSASPRTRDYARGVREGGCPECGHDSLVVTQALIATRVDPACWSGRCTCAERNREYRDGKTECPECGPAVSDIHDAGGIAGAHDECDPFFHPEGPTCGCECHCGCDFET